jgi:outer membrane protein assembly factor BamB
MTMKRPTLLVVLGLLTAAVALAQPQGRVLWSAEGNDGIYSLVTIPDVNGDARPDVVAAIYYSAYPSDPRKAYCLSGADGDTLWVNRTAYGTWGNKALDASPDLNGDGYADALLGTSGTYIPPGRACVAISGFDGSNLWINSPFPQDTWGWVYSVRSFVDVNGDTVPEAIAGTGGVTNDPSGHVVLISGRTGATLWTFRVPLDGCGSVAPFVDVNGDSVPEVLAGAYGNSTDNNVYCISGANGAQVWSHQRTASVSDVKSIADVNASGRDDCVGGGWDHYVYCLEGGTGAQIWQVQPAGSSIIMELAPIRDVNADGIDDVVVGSWNSNVYVLSGLNGSTLWSGAVGSDVWAVDTLADVSGDGVPEVIAGCLGDGNGSVRVFSGADGQALWYYNFTERVYDVTGAPDLDGDGRADVLVGLQDHENLPGHIYCLSGTASALSDEPPAGPPEMLDVRCAAGRLLIAAAPTPLQLRVFDPAGRLVAGRVFAPSDHPRTVELRDLVDGSGTYFVDCESGGRKAALKAVAY